jgi:hypothetical protein
LSTPEQDAACGMFSMIKAHNRFAWLNHNFPQGDHGLFKSCETNPGKTYILYGGFASRRGIA